MSIICCRGGAASDVIFIDRNDENTDVQIISVLILPTGNFFKKLYEINFLMKTFRLLGKIIFLFLDIQYFS